MNWQEDHDRRVAAFPADMRQAHGHAANHRAEVLSSSLCGCFYCSSTYAPSAIEEWTDEDDHGVGTTALCPRCGIDSVIGDRAGFPLSSEFLEKMRAYWF